MRAQMFGQCVCAFWIAYRQRVLTQQQVAAVLLLLGGVEQAEGLRWIGFACGYVQRFGHINRTTGNKQAHARLGVPLHAFHAPPPGGDQFGAVYLCYPDLQFRLDGGVVPLPLLQIAVQAASLDAFYPGVFQFKKVLFQRGVVYHVFQHRKNGR